jgi:hypothetical protein
MEAYVLLSKDQILLKTNYSNRHGEPMSIHLDLCVRRTLDCTHVPIARQGISPE